MYLFSTPEPTYNNQSRNGLLQVGDRVRMYAGVGGKEILLGLVTGWDWYCPMHKRLNMLSPVVLLEEAATFFSGARQLPVPIFSLERLEESLQLVA